MVGIGGSSIYLHEIEMGSFSFWLFDARGNESLPPPFFLRFVGFSGFRVLGMFFLLFSYERENEKLIN